MSLKQDVHDTLWHAFKRWQDVRQTGVSKHDLKMRGIHEANDPNRFTRNLIFTGNTLRSYEGVLKNFVDQAAKEFGVTQLRDIGKVEFRAFMDRSIAKGLAVKTLNRYRSALAKLGALIGKTESFKALSKKYGVKIRKLAKEGALPTPTRQTPSREVVERAIEKLRRWDAREFARTGVPRAYHLAARLQLDTSVRSVSATDRFTAPSLRDGDQVAMIGKGGKEQVFKISPELHRTLSLYLRHNPGELAPKRAYHSAYRRAILAAEGRVTGTHGIRRRAAQDFHSQAYKDARKSGLSTKEASEKARGDAIERLGHSRNRADHRKWYLSA